MESQSEISNRQKRILKFLKIEIPPSIQCRGCGREISTKGLRLLSRFHCKECHMMMLLTRKLIKFRFTERRRKWQNFGTWFGILTLATFPIFGVLRMSYESGEWLFCYSIAIPLALIPAVYFHRIRKKSKDLQLAGGFLSLFTSLDRFIVIEMARGIGYATPLKFTGFFWFCLINGVLLIALVPVARRIWPAL